ncbi:MAG: hypothetical protein SFU86_19810 [Pirellulaceae bacterium]|nr:hypothetical protein [Pirellulaceae bacterium]
MLFSKWSSSVGWLLMASALAVLLAGAANAQRGERGDRGAGRGNPGGGRGIRQPTAPPRGNAPRVATPRVELPRIAAPANPRDGNSPVPRVAQLPRLDRSSPPRVEVPRVTAPRVDGPRVDGPRVDGPRVDGPKTDGPRVDGPRVDGPRVDGPRVDGPRVGGPKTDGPRVDGPRTDGPRVDGPRVGGPRVDGPRVDGPRVDGPKTDGPRTGEPRSDRPRTDGPQVGDRNPDRDSRGNASWRRPNNNDLDKIRVRFDSALRAVTGDRGMDRWVERNPSRIQHWNGWGADFRTNYRYSRYPYFGHNFWNGRNLIGVNLGVHGGRWGYQPWAGGRPWWYWYGTPAWTVFAGWYGWNRPYYYDYGPGGNVVYQQDQVYVNQQPVGTPDDYAQSAAALAAVDAELIAATPAADWQALGTFMIVTSEQEKDPARMIQLAVSQKGLISGSMYNRETDKAYSVQGRVDPETQRVAFTFGDRDDIVLETGLYNLTRQEAPVLVHFGPNKTATYVFVRLPEPEHTDPPAAALPEPQSELP